MHRTQLLLPPAHVQFLQDEAARHGVSMSELIRQWIAERMEAAGGAAGEDAGTFLIGIGRGGIGRASETHDEELSRIRAARARTAAQQAKSTAKTMTARA